VESNNDLFELGKIALQKQSDYLKLKIEKESANDGTFEKDEQLLQAHADWQEASKIYRTACESSDNP
jgi:hypothetical protein